MGCVFFSPSHRNKVIFREVLQFSNTHVREQKQAGKAIPLSPITHWGGEIIKNKQANKAGESGCAAPCKSVWKIWRKNSRVWFRAGKWHLLSSGRSSLRRKSSQINPNKLWLQHWRSFYSCPEGVLKLSLWNCLINNSLGVIYKGEPFRAVCCQELFQLFNPEFSTNWLRSSFNSN